MKTFLALYVGTASSLQKWSDLDADQLTERARAGLDAWAAWKRANADVLPFKGCALGKTKRTSAAGVTNVTNDMTGFAIVQAETHEAAARLFENHPHFTIFPGEAVDIVECLPPQQ